MNTSSGRKVLAISSYKNPFEEKLILEGYATSEQFALAKEEYVRFGTSLIEALEGVIGQSLPPSFTRFYKQVNLFELKVLYGIDAIDLNIIENGKFNLAKLINPDTISIDVCREYQVIPLSKDDIYLSVAIVSPNNGKALDELNRLAGIQKLILKYKVIPLEDFLLIFDQIIKIQNQENGDLIKEESLELNADQEYDPEFDLVVLTQQNTAPIIKLVEQILFRAIKEDASEILLEPLKIDIRLQLRIDGRLQDVIEDSSARLPIKIITFVTNRLKIIANLDITKCKVSQFGKFYRLFEGRKINFHITTIPIANGEKVVIKVLDTLKIRQNMDQLIIDPVSRLVAENLCSERSGLVVVTGESGMGISTTLYSLLNQANRLGRSVYTVEDPIEFSLSGTKITQVEVLPSRDMVTALQSVQGQNPEMLMVSEIKSPQIGRMLIESASKFSILSSLSANHSVTALNQLLEMVASKELSTTLNGIIFQRLLRRVCDNCRIPHILTNKEINEFGLSKSDKEYTFYRANTLSQKEVAEGKSGDCPKCGGKGYKGRIAAFEIMPITEDMRKPIIQGISADRIRQIAITEGMKTLLEYSLDLAKQGYTTLDEIAQLIASNSLLNEEREIKLGNFPPIQVNIASVKNFPVELDVEQIFLSIVETLDLLDFISQSFKPQSPLEQALYSNYRQMREQLFQVLQKSGISCIETIGKQFNPNFHELVGQKSTIMYPINSIASQIRFGYVLGDRVLRRAQVEVAVSTL